MSAIGRGVIMVTGPGGGGGGPCMGFVLTIPIIMGSLIGGYIYSFNPLYAWFLLTEILVISTIISIVFLRDTNMQE